MQRSLCTPALCSAWRARGSVQLGIRDAHCIFHTRIMHMYAVLLLLLLLPLLLMLLLLLLRLLGLRS